jgi:hypothetical protein
LLPSQDFRQLFLWGTRLDDKSIDAVMETQRDLVDVVHTLRQGGLREGVKQEGAARSSLQIRM